MSTEDNRALVRRAIEDLNQGNLGEADKYFTPNFVYHDAANPQVRTREQYRQLLITMQAAFTSLFTIEDLIAEEDKVVARYTTCAIHRGSWRGIPPTGKPVVATGTNTYRVASGKIAELWQNADILSLLQQLGVIPAPGQAS